MYLLCFLVCEDSLDSGKAYSYKNTVALDERYKANDLICFIQSRNNFLARCVSKSQLLLVLLLVEQAGSKRMSHSQAWGTPCEHRLVFHVYWDTNKIQAGFCGLIILGTMENHWEPGKCQAGVEEILISD